MADERALAGEGSVVDGEHAATNTANTQTLARAVTEPCFVRLKPDATEASLVR